MAAIETNYNPFTHTVNSTPGFDVHVPSWRSFASSSLGFVTTYWMPFGYEVNKTIFTASFDWRFPSLGQAAYYKNLRLMVEEVSTLNNNLPVDLIAVSYGPQIALGFLHRMTTAWKTRYIRWFVAESPLWSGAVMSAASFIDGIPPPDGQAFIRLVSDAIHSLLWIFPRPGTTNTTWSDDEIIVTTPSRKYTASNLTQMLNDLGFSLRAESLADLRAEPDLNTFAAPGVNTFVTYGTDITTNGYLDFAYDFTTNRSDLLPLPTYVPDPAGGDSLVPVRSSRRSLYEWPARQKALGVKFLSKAYSQQQHAYCAVSVDKYSTPCFNDVAFLLIKGTIPSGLDPGSVV